METVPSNQLTHSFGLDTESRLKIASVSRLRPAAPGRFSPFRNVRFRRGHRPRRLPCFRAVSHRPRNVTHVAAASHSPGSTPGRINKEPGT